MSNIVNTSYKFLSRVSYFKGIIPEKVTNKKTEEVTYKYSSTVLVPKEDKVTIKAIKAAIEFVKKEKWPNKIPKGLKVVFRDGDLEFEDGGVPKTVDAGVEPYGGHYFFASWKDQDKPAIIGPAGNALNNDDVPRDHIVSGDYCFIKIKFFAWDQTKDGNGAGISANIKAYQLVSKGEPLGNTVDVEEGFKPLEGAEDDPDGIMDLV